MADQTTATISKKRKFVADGVLYAELDAFLTKELGEDGYGGVEVRVTPLKTEIIVRATRTQSVLGENGRRIRELTSLVQKRFGFKPDSVEMFAEKVERKSLCAMSQAESLKYKLLGGLPVRRACYGIIKNIMENGAKGVEIIVSGKLRAQRAKAMKFRDGYMIKSGNAARQFIDKAIRNVEFKQGVIGIMIKIMLNPETVEEDRRGAKPSNRSKYPDKVIVRDPKSEESLPLPPTRGYTENLEQLAAAQAAPVAVPIGSSLPPQATPLAPPQ